MSESVLGILVRATDQASAVLGQIGNAGEQGGQRTEKAWAAAKVALGVAGAAAGAAVGIAARGGAELTATMASFRAETGATAEEAEAAQDSIARLYRGNIEGFAQLGGVLAAVRTNLGLTGAEGEAAAARILDFARVTGQDAVAATGQLDDIMDSLNLSYAEGSVVLDQLVASQQRFGGSVAVNAAALAGLAPALRAANLSVDDGIGLLNLFAASGIDAEVAGTALTRALAQVESPAELQRLLADINATVDPFERARKASELFGDRAGAKLAAALDGVDFASFQIGAEAAAGAIDEAAAVIDEAPYNRLQLALRQVTGPLAEIGTQFGPLILGLSTIAGPLMPVVTGALGGLAHMALPAMKAGLLAIQPALVATAALIGKAIGVAKAIAIPLGMVALPALLVAALVAAVAFLVANPEIVGKIAAFVRSILDAIGSFLAGVGAVFARAFGAAVEAVSGAVGRIVGFIGGLPGRIAGTFLALVRQWLELHVRIASIALDLAAQVVGFVLSIPERAAGWIAGLVAGAGQAATGFIGRITGLAGDVIGILLGIPGRAMGALVSGFVNLARGAVDAFLNLIRGIPGQVMGILGGIGGAIAGIIPGFATGISDVPRDMLAVLHRGEMVVPAANAARIRAGEGGLSIDVGGVTFNAQHMSASESEARAFARQLWVYLEDEANRRGRGFALAGGVR